LMEEGNDVDAVAANQKGIKTDELVIRKTGRSLEGGGSRYGSGADR